MRYIVIVLILWSYTVSAQDCEYTVNEIDSFTGAKKLQTESRAVYSWRTNENLYLTFRRIDDIYKLDIILSESDGIEKGDHFLLKLSNGEIIELSADNDYFYDVEDYGEVIAENIRASYDISENQIKMIADQGIVEYRVYFIRSYKDLEAGKKFIKRVQRAAACVLQSP